VRAAIGRRRQGMLPRMPIIPVSRNECLRIACSETVYRRHNSMQIDCMESTYQLKIVLKAVKHLIHYNEHYNLITIMNFKLFF